MHWRVSSLWYYGVLWQFLWQGGTACIFSRDVTLLGGNFSHPTPIYCFLAWKLQGRKGILLALTFYVATLGSEKDSLGRRPWDRVAASRPSWKTMQNSVLWTVVSQTFSKSEDQCPWGHMCSNKDWGFQFMMLKVEEDKHWSSQSSVIDLIVCWHSREAIETLNMGKKWSQQCWNLRSHSKWSCFPNQMYFQICRVIFWFDCISFPL